MKFRTSEDFNPQVGESRKNKLTDILDATSLSLLISEAAHQSPNGDVSPEDVLMDIAAMVDEVLSIIDAIPHADSIKNIGDES